MATDPGYIELMNLIDGTDENPFPHGQIEGLEKIKPGDPEFEPSRSLQSETLYGADEESSLTSSATDSIYGSAEEGSVDMYRSTMMMFEEIEDKDAYLRRQQLVENDLRTYMHPNPPTSTVLTCSTLWMGIQCGMTDG